MLVERVKVNSDFTMNKYKDLCLTLLDSGYTPQTVCSYLEGQTKQKKSVVLRHDIDRKPGNALRMAALESELGIRSTYYFRFPYTFKPDIFRKINEWIFNYMNVYAYNIGKKILIKVGGNIKYKVKGGSL